MNPSYLGVKFTILDASFDVKLLFWVGTPPPPPTSCVFNYVSFLLRVVWVMCDIYECTLSFGLYFIDSVRYISAEMYGMCRG